MPFTRRFLTGATLASAALLAVCPALVHAQSFPNQTIRIIVPYPAGGASDVAARLLAPRLQQELKQNVVVENKPGASGNLGMVTLLQAPADGHTIGLALTGMLSINHYGLALPEVPFGGVKESGHGTEGGSEALEGYFDTRFVTRKG